MRRIVAAKTSRCRITPPSRLHRLPYDSQGRPRPCRQRRVAARPGSAAPSRLKPATHTNTRAALKCASRVIRRRPAQTGTKLSGAARMPARPAVCGPPPGAPDERGQQRALHERGHAAADAAAAASSANPGNRAGLLAAGTPSPAQRALHGDVRNVPSDVARRGVPDTRRRGRPGRARRRKVQARLVSTGHAVGVSDCRLLPSLSRQPVHQRLACLPHASCTASRISVSRLGNLSRPRVTVNSRPGVTAAHGRPWPPMAAHGRPWPPTTDGHVTQGASPPPISARPPLAGAGCATRRHASKRRLRRVAVATRD